VRVQGGTNLYGFTVGILMLDTRFPRIPGDMGNATTFDFPVRYHRVTGASPDRVVRQGQRELLPAFVEGARFLEREGVRAITTNCGFLAKFQPELAASVSVPVFTSSLLLVPLVQRMLPAGRAVGVLTVNAASLHHRKLSQGRWWCIPRKRGRRLLTGMASTARSPALSPTGRRRALPGPRRGRPRSGRGRPG